VPSLVLELVGRWRKTEHLVKRKAVSRSMTVRTSAVLMLLGVMTVVYAEADSHSDRVDELFERYNRADSPGCAVGVILDGKLVHAKGRGLVSTP
jgi:CubicO group peptidase (beta-lactamase class C family)